MPTMSGHVHKAFLSQADACNRLGSPFTGQLCDLLPKILDRNTRFGTRILDWPETAKPDALALRATGALHALVRSGEASELASLYPPHKAAPETLGEAIGSAIAAHDEMLHAFLDSPPQTNEVARSAALLGLALHVADKTGIPLALYELGASAGLNLAFDKYYYDLGDQKWGNPTATVVINAEWHGNLPPVNASLEIASRAGCDRQPLDPASQTDVERQLSYIWADQGYRIERTGNALAAAAKLSLKIEKADAAEWIEAQLALPATPGIARVVFHSIVWQYLPEETKSRIASAIEHAGAQATSETPLVWMSMEAEGNPRGAVLALTQWPGGEKQQMGIADYHGRWVEWA